MLFKLLAAALITMAIYPAIALALIATDSPHVPESARAGGVDFAASIAADYSGMPPPSEYAARDGAALGYRLYGDPATAQRLIVLLHGSGWHGMQFHALARSLEQAGVGAIAVPDLRGHGPRPARRGDVDHIGQFEEDIADLVDHLKALAGPAPVVLGGHSSGGGLAVRFAGGTYGGKADAFVLIAPFLKYNAPTTKPNSGGWAYPATRRIVGLTMLNAVGVTALNHLPVIAFAMPQAVLDGPYGATATTRYSFRLNTSFAPRSDYRADLAAITRPLLVVAGDSDEAFDALRYEEVIAAETGTGTYRVLAGATHIGILTDLRLSDAVAGWITREVPAVAR